MGCPAATFIAARARRAALLVAVTVVAVRAHAGGAEKLFVQATSVNVRAQPAPTAEIVGRLRINAAVTVHQRRDGWVHLRYTLGSRDIVSGWANEALLGATPIARGAGPGAKGPQEDAAALLRNLERATAANAEDPHLWQRLEEQYARAQKSALAAWAHRVRTGTERTYVAGCLAGVQGEPPEVVLVGAVEASGEASGLTWQGRSEIGAEVEALRWDLAGGRWYPIGNAAADTWNAWAYPFAAPRIVVEGDGRARLVLGPCPQAAGTLYVSQAVVPLSPTGALDFADTPKKIAALYGESPPPAMRAVERVAVRHITDLLVCRNDGRISRALFDRAGTLVSHRTVARAGDPSEPCDLAGSTYPWVRLRFGDPASTWSMTFVQHTTEVHAGMDGYHEAQLCLLTASRTRPLSETCVAYSHSDL